ncbi:MAG: class I SAM-dependent methyltransferase [Nitrospiraceae bacterium]|nr:class I SAM-dependent methyltransferase [Nitrospiraceae bacterium]
MAEIERQRDRVVRSFVDHIEPEAVEAVWTGFRNTGLHCEHLTVSPEAFRAYVQDAEYEGRFPDYCNGYRSVLDEKSLEHFIARSILDPRESDTLIDLASEHSPLSDIVSRLTGCRAFRQDIMHPPGINGERIGGDACRMPIPDGFADKITLTCSLEHFEGDSDSRLFVEMYRVLKPGGMVCVVPFYAFPSAANQTDPTIGVPNNVPFDSSATIFCAHGWGNRFARFYSPESFVKRIAERTGSLFDYTLYRLMNTGAIHSGIYARFVLLARKRPNT